MRYGIVKKRIISIFILLSCICILGGCSQNKKEKQPAWNVSETTSHYISDDGWVYVFSYTSYSDGSTVESPYTFYGINLRYRYNDAYMTEPVYDKHGELVSGPQPQKIQILGRSDSEEIKRDMDKVSKLLGYNTETVTKEDLLAIDRQAVTFEELDKDMFFRLMDECLESEPNPTGGYVDIPSYALLTEPEYIDGYKFQIGFIGGIGTVDIIYIDVLYKTGSEYNAYEQLSDMVDDNTATDAQVSAFQLISEISGGIVKDNNLLYGYDENGQTLIGDIDLSRLYLFLKDIEKYNFTKYEPM